MRHFEASGSVRVTKNASKSDHITLIFPSQLDKLSVVSAMCCIFSARECCRSVPVVAKQLYVKNVSIFSSLGQI